MTTERSRMMADSLIDWTNHVLHGSVKPSQLLPNLRRAAEEFPATTDHDLNDAAWDAYKAILRHGDSIGSDIDEAEALYVMICSGI